MKSMIIASLTALLSGAQAQALSCVQPDVARTFGWASDADERYVILLGAFGFVQPPNGFEGFEPRAEQIEAMFEGRFLTAEGFVEGPALDVTLSFECAASWCGAINTGEELLSFVEQTSDGYILRVGPCSATTFRPDAQNVQTVESCVRGGPCVERNF